MIKIAVFVGSLQQKSFNKMLAKNLEVVKSDDVKFEYVDINLPLFNQDLEANFPKKAQAVKDIVFASDGVLFVTPEYNRSVPGVLKNAIDWTSRPYGNNAFKGKPVGIVGATVINTGTAAAQAELRNVIGYLEMKYMGFPEVYISEANDVFDGEGTLLSERWKKNFSDYMKSFIAWIEREK